MNIIDILNEHQHKVGWQVLAQEALSNPELLDALFQVLLTGQEQYARTSAEVLRHVSDHDPTVAQPYIDQLIERINTATHPGITRCIFRLFQRARFTEDQEGTLIEVGFEHLNNRNNPIAIRVFAMSTLANITKKYPELHEELIAVLQDNLGEESAGYQNRAMKIINGTWK
jgi:hypothetical protein